MGEVGMRLKYGDLDLNGDQFNIDYNKYAFVGDPGMPEHVHSITPPSSFVSHDHHNCLTLGCDTTYPRPPVQFFRHTRFDKDSVIGYMDGPIVTTSRGLEVKIKANTKEFADGIKKLQAFCSNPLITSSEARHILGLNTTIKENGMAINIKLKTPHKNIKRKDLRVALRLMGISSQDELLNAIALVQDLTPYEQIFRIHEHKDAKMVGRFVRVPGSEIAGMCSDVKPTGDHYSGDVQLVISGKLETLSAHTFVVVAVNEADPLDHAWNTAHKD